MDNINFNVTNYDLAKDSRLLERENLNFIYEDICKIENELITILDIINRY